MPTKKEAVPVGSIKERLDWDRTFELLRTGQYEQVAKFLYQAQLLSEQADNAILADILAASLHICWACRQFEAEVTRYRQACAEINRREHDLTRLLQAILHLVSGRDMPEPPEDRTVPPLVLEAQRNLLEPYSSAAGNPNFLQRIQSLLGWGASPRSSESESPAETFLIKADPFSNETGDLAAFSPEQGKGMELAPVKPGKQKDQHLPTLVIYCLGPFRVYQDDQPVADWPSSRGKSIFKYMIIHRERPVAKEVLMELFWPDAHPDAARNNLNVAIYGLRQALHDIRPDFSHVLFQDDCYLLNPELQIWVDVEAFREHLKTAQSLERHRELASAMQKYRAAEAMYQGEFLAEDRYEDWLMPQRQSLQADYLKHDSCVTMCDKFLAVDPCREEAHRRLMRCYVRRGQRYLALRQYQLCVETLQEEVDVSPTSATTALYEQIRQGRSV
jgi:DNA-binding SARP family transcriptional activator